MKESSLNSGTTGQEALETEDSETGALEEDVLAEEEIIIESMALAIMTEGMKKEEMTEGTEKEETGISGEAAAEITGITGIVPEEDSLPEGDIKQPDRLLLKRIVSNTIFRLGNWSVYNNAVFWNRFFW